LTISLDFDWFYRKFFKEIGGEFALRTSAAQEAREAQMLAGALRMIDRLYQHHGPESTLARTWPTGIMVLWVAVLLGVSLLFYYV
jgi:multicomponent Na+:H+ antiporter subunit D